MLTALPKISYWNEPADVDTGIANATILQDDSFGPDGSGDDYCVQSGPFANLTLYLDDDGNASESYCLSRALSDNQLAKGEQSVVDDCVYNQTTFEDAWSCFESNGPHGAGHGGMYVISQSHPLTYPRLIRPFPSIRA